MSLFTDHPYSHGLSYWQHLKLALWGSFKLLYAGTTCLIHAFLPFLFKWKATDTCVEILEKVETTDLRSNFK